MKQFNLLPAKALMILFAFFLVACEDDESEEPNANPLIGGTWQWTIRDKTNCGEPADEGRSFFTDCVDGCHYYVFNADGTLTFNVIENGTSETTTGHYTLEDKNFTLCVTYDGVDYCDSGEITVSGDTFSFFIPKEEEASCDVSKTYERE